MKRSLKMQLALGILSATSVQLYAAGRHSNGAERHSVAIHVYDLAGVSARDLHEATEEAGRILATAGVEAAWQFGDADAPEAHEVDSHAAIRQRPEPAHDTRDFLVLRMVRDFPERALAGCVGDLVPRRAGPVCMPRFSTTALSGRARLAMLPWRRCLATRWPTNWGTCCLETPSTLRPES